MLMQPLDDYLLLTKQRYTYIYIYIYKYSSTFVYGNGASYHKLLQQCAQWSYKSFFYN